MDDDLKSTSQVKEWLASHEGLSWIVESSLHLRAFYWGLYSGMGLDESEKANRDTVLVRVWTDTMFLKPADDPFRLTELHGRIEHLRGELHRRLESSNRRAIPNQDGAEPGTENTEITQSMETLLQPIQDCVQDLNDRWAYHQRRIRDGLERAGAVTPTEALEILHTLEDSFRILAVGERNLT